MSAVFGSVPFIIVANTAIEIVVYATGDSIAQRLEHASKVRKQSRPAEKGGKTVACLPEKFKHDFDRTIRGGVLSAACGGGAVGWYWWVMLDNLIPGSSLGTLAVKSLINNAVYGTLANELFLYCYTASRTGSHAEGCARAKEDFAEQSLLNFLLYFPTDIICFSVTGWPRTFFYHGSVLVFDTYFSLLANKKDALRREAEVALGFWTGEMPAVALNDSHCNPQCIPPIPSSPSLDESESDGEIVTETTVTTSTIVNTMEAVVDSEDAMINTTTTTINQVTTIRTTTKTPKRFRSGTAASAEKSKAGRWYDRFLDLYHNRYHQQYQQCHSGKTAA
eukprot:TRINITY_DN14842_c0_g1_i1.p1 TRINITY_DN14842_c0_g1~~TRINITY_DN14842_c0_g1_i1.p1  ORF type:complete len:335 (-),score=49.04 TRINITY_DN14842_c0_g1_i1:210-1214(-)